MPEKKTPSQKVVSRFPDTDTLTERYPLRGKTKLYERPNPEAALHEAVRMFEEMLEDPENLTLQNWARDIAGTVKFDYLGRHENVLGATERESPQDITLYGRENSNPARVLTTLLHELQHRKTTRSFPGINNIRIGPQPRETRRSIREAAKFSERSGHASANAIFEALQEQGIFYRDAEPMAFLAPLLLPGPQHRAPDLVDFVHEYPVFVNELARLQMHPETPPAEHFRGYPEWSWLEKTLDRIFPGVFPPPRFIPVNTKVPPNVDTPNRGSEKKKE